MTPSDTSISREERVARAIRPTVWQLHDMNLSDEFTEAERLMSLSTAETAIAALSPNERLIEALPKRIGRLTLGERLSQDHYCGGSHDMPDGQPIYWQERGGEYPDDIDGYCLTCAIQQAESDAGWCECEVRKALSTTKADQ